MRDRVRLKLYAMVWGLAGLGCVAIVGCMPRASDEQCPHAGDPGFGQYVIYVEGAGGTGRPQCFANVESGLRRGGFMGDVLDFAWNTGDGLLADHVISREYKRARATELAALIQQLAAAHDPPPSIDLLAFSAGSVVAALALEQLPAPLVRNVVFVQSSLSHAHDLTAALSNVRGGLANFTSPTDPLLLATSIVGTADREFCGPCAIGLGGAPSGAAIRSCEVRWQRRFVARGHFGGHFDPLNADFVAAEIVPHLFAE